MQNIVENKIENTIITNEIVNNTVENVIEEETEEAEGKNEGIDEEEQETADPTQEMDMSIIQKQESDEEKAISIAKEAWGNDNNVVFTYEENKDGIYVIFVRDAASRRQIDLIKVNINTGKVVQ